MSYMRWDSNQIKIVSDPASNLELSNLLGTQSFNFASPTRKAIPPLFQNKPFQIPLLESNYALASNQGIKRMEPEQGKLKQGSPFHSVFAHCVDMKAGSPSFIQSKIAWALFVSSLPDITSEFRDAYNQKKYRELPSAVVTALFNTPLFLFHAAAQSVQALSQVLAAPTMLAGLAFSASEQTKSKGINYAYKALGAVLVIATAPFQIFNLLANTINYVRHVVDGVATAVKAIVNTVVDGVCGAGREKIKSNWNQLKYACIDTVKNAFRLLPVAAAAAVGYVTAGAGLVVAPAVMAFGVTLLSQALSLVRIAVGNVVNSLIGEPGKEERSSRVSKTESDSEQLTTNPLHEHSASARQLAGLSASAKGDSKNVDRSAASPSRSVHSELLASRSAASVDTHQHDDSDSDSESESPSPQ